MYTAYGLLRPDSDFSVEELEKRLAAKFPGFGVTRDSARVTIAQGEWWIALDLVSGEHVRNETEGLLGRIAGVEPAETVEYVASSKRVEVWTDVPDPFMEHFNDYLTVVEVLKGFNGLLAVDPKAPGTL